MDNMTCLELGELVLQLSAVEALVLGLLLRLERHRLGLLLGLAGLRKRQKNP